MEKIVSVKKEGTYAWIKRSVYEIVQPGASSSRLALIFDFAIMLLIVASVAIVFMVTFDLPPAVMEVLKKTDELPIPKYAAASSIVRSDCLF